MVPVSVESWSSGGSWRCCRQWNEVCAYWRWDSTWPVYPCAPCSSLRMWKSPPLPFILAHLKRAGFLPSKCMEVFGLLWMKTLAIAEGSVRWTLKPLMVDLRWHHPGRLPYFHWFEGHSWNRSCVGGSIRSCQSSFLKKTHMISMVRCSFDPSWPWHRWWRSLFSFCSANVWHR